MSRLVIRGISCAWVAIASIAGPFGQTERVTAYRIEAAPTSQAALRERFSGSQLRTLEKLNRADLDHLGRLRTLVVPDVWRDEELAYAVLPASYPPAGPYAKLVVVYVPGQVFGAYEEGTLVRWGPVSSGARANPTPEGLFFLNWRAAGHTSTVDPEWFMRWYFNFGNREGLAFHEYALPGLPASHGCIRLLQRDAAWLFQWGDEWVLDSSATRVLRPGTPVVIVGSYDFGSPPPWHSREWLKRTVELPPGPDEQPAARAASSGCVVDG